MIRKESSADRPKERALAPAFVISLFESYFVYRGRHTCEKAEFHHCKYVINSRISNCQYIAFDRN
ncbi:uncharacterized protein PgNI_08753 [Pyricularia grisea]|uniref:Uncharacterized protein n=1 Tax=Pyricularia grisea TaxID=148305 RepID=A0A6P8AVQ2_PYRGI|nr:uncharacterized protein PgNI_08753 [Pyricularia grisea]TLD06301.1 hypothetical protein PgNI_08753 [Pyricularia grisea]